MQNRQHIQRLEGLARKAIQQYGMIENGDAVCVGVSGGKDSVALAVALQNLSQYHEHRFTVSALTLDPCFGGEETDYTRLTEFFTRHGIPHTVQRTDIGPLVFEVRREANPCALCAKMRRGVLHAGAKALGCNKIALGHHLDDAVETFFMNLFSGGHIACFSPRSWLSRRQITLIRPLVLARETQVERAAAALDAPILKSRCPVDGHTKRAETKQFVAARSQADPAFCQKILGALQGSGISGWAPNGGGNHSSEVTCDGH